jgi:hypothetical protein
MTRAQAQVADDVVDDIHRSLGRLTKATVAGYVVSIVIAIFAGYFGNATREGACALRADVERRVAVSKTFLEDRPEALRALGFTKTDVRKEIANQERTVDSLRVVPCF